MNVQRISAFFLIIAITIATIAWSSPSILRDIKLGLDLKGGFEILYVATPIEENQELTPEILREAARSLEQRAVGAGGVAEPEVTPEGTDRIRVKLAGVENPEDVRRILKKPAELSFQAPDGTKELRGNDFVEGGAEVNYENNLPIIALKVKDADKFRDVTSRLLGQPLAIVLDDEVISAPTVSAVITNGQAIINGMDSYEEAQRIAGIINLGALPVNLEEKYTQSVGATLGKASLDDTVKAGTIGSILIFLFMVIYYRLPGLVAAFTIITYIWMLLLVFDWMNATLTLPGIAAFVLGVGMAVDANIITYERIKEEIRSGKSMLSSLKAGSRNSFRTIIDANITTIIAGAVLLTVGTGAIVGFALTLILSILVSVITNVFFSRLLLYLLIRGNLIRKPAYFGVKEAEISEL
jgi:preprotein translocase subunit SecD